MLMNKKRASQHAWRRNISSDIALASLARKRSHPSLDKLALTKASIDLVLERRTACEATPDIPTSN